MKDQLFRILLFGLFCMACPGTIGAELQRPTLINESHYVEQPKRNNVKRGEWKRNKIIKPTSNRPENQIYNKLMSTASKRAWLVIGILFLSFLAIIFLFAFVGFIFLSMPMGAPGDPDKWKFPIGLLLILILPALCILGIARMIKKLRKLKNADMPEELPRRPPSKKMK